MFCLLGALESLELGSRVSSLAWTLVDFLLEIVGGTAVGCFLRKSVQRFLEGWSRRVVGSYYIRGIY